MNKDRSGSDMFLSLLQDGLPACSTARQVSGEPWKLEPKVETTVETTVKPEDVTIVPSNVPSIVPSGGTATNSSIILTLICFLFNSIRA